MPKVEIDITDYELQDIKKFCELNNIDFDKALKKSLKTGYNIEKYGLLGKTSGIEEKRVEIEVIREKRVEIPVEVIKEIEIIKEIPVEVVKEIVVEKEIIKEIPVEKIVTIYENNNEEERKNFSIKIQELEDENKKMLSILHEKENLVQDDNKLQQLQQTIQSLMGRIREKDNEIKLLKEQIENMGLTSEIKNAMYLRSSNLGDNLYK